MSQELQLEFFASGKTFKLKSFFGTISSWKLLEPFFDSIQRIHTDAVHVNDRFFVVFEHENEVKVFQRELSSWASSWNLDPLEIGDLYICQTHHEKRHFWQTDKTVNGRNQRDGGSEISAKFPRDLTPDWPWDWTGCERCNPWPLLGLKFQRNFTDSRSPSTKSPCRAQKAGKCW